MKKINLFFYTFLITIFLNSCSSRYIQLVSAVTKTEFGFTLTAPSQCIFFVENIEISAPKGEIEIHTKTANSIYNKYGPSTDKLFVGRTNARQFKFNINNKTYFIDITKFKKRTAMILFTGKAKPIIEYNEKRYQSLIQSYFSL